MAGFQGTDVPDPVLLDTLTAMTVNGGVPGWSSVQGLRLHDRLAYRPDGEGWRIERLAP